MWDFLMFLLTEILPTTIFIIVAKLMKENQAKPKEDNEMSNIINNTNFT